MIGSIGWFALRDPGSFVLAQRLQHQLCQLFFVFGSATWTSTRDGVPCAMVQKNRFDGLPLSVTKARAKLSWPAFEDLHRDAVRLAYELWPGSDGGTWQGLSVLAIDGSKYDLLASPALRMAFDPDSGLDRAGKGHYPQCLVSTVQDVFRRLPIARTVRPIADANEREELKALLPFIPPGGALLCDRGYPSDDLIDFVSRHYLGYW